MTVPAATAPAMASPNGPLAAHGRIPALTIAVEEASAQEYAAAPTLRFGLRLTTDGDAPIRSVMLTAQLRIAVGARAYDAATRARLREVLGTREQGATTMRSLFWTQATLLVPPFTGSTTIDLPVACTYDLDVAATRLLHGVEDGALPLEFLFSGTIFYAGPDGRLLTARIPWDREARFALPVATWRAMMDHYFPDSAWIRLRRDALERLRAYRAEHGLPNWEEAIERLVGSSGSQVAGGAVASREAQDARNAVGSRESQDVGGAA